MTDEVVVRDAQFDEIRYIMEMTRLMICDIERYGGHTPRTDKCAWNRYAERITEELEGDNGKYLIAEVAQGKRIGLAGARLNTLEGLVATKKIIHISVL